MQYLNLISVNGASLIYLTLENPDYSKNNHRSTNFVQENDTDRRIYRLLKLQFSKTAIIISRTHSNLHLELRTPILNFLRSVFEEKVLQ